MQRFTPNHHNTECNNVLAYLKVPQQFIPLLPSKRFPTSVLTLQSGKPHFIVSWVLDTGSHVVCFIETQGCEGFGDCCCGVSGCFRLIGERGGLTVGAGAAEAEDEAAHGDCSFAILVSGGWLGLHI